MLLTSTLFTSETIPNSVVINFVPTPTLIKAYYEFNVMRSQHNLKLFLRKYFVY